MAIQIIGPSGQIAQVEASLALRVTPRATDVGALGSYSVGLITGILPAALAANSEIFQFRWVDATRLCVIREIRIGAVVSTTFFAAGVPVQIDLVKATAWSVQGTGGTGITPAATLKRRTSHGNSLVAAGDIRVATTAALGAGTKTLEGNSLAALVAPGPITASLNGQIIAPGTPLYQAEVGDGEYPLVLVANEGFVVRSVAVPATGTWTASLIIEYFEVTAY